MYSQCNIHPKRERDRDRERQREREGGERDRDRERGGERERVTYTEEALILRKPFLILVKLQLVSDLWRDNNN